ncbi:MAG: RluA family pseudouridine synthase [Synergistaceae bacterium]|nr:RluA family pseudouridine synthase [Synergistaceae bacterium]
MTPKPEENPSADKDFDGDDEIEYERVEHIEADPDGSRLDVFLSRTLGITRSFAQKLLKEGRVRSSRPAAEAPEGSKGKLKPSRLLTSPETFVVLMPPPELLEIEPENVPFDVIHEDQWLLVVNKPAGLVVHPAPGHRRGTLVHGLLWRYADLGPFNNVRRPGIVHRLDATTSGLMLIAREQKTMELLQTDFRTRSIEKKYLALAHGNFDRKSGILEGPIGRHPQNRLKMAVIEGGRPSATEYRVLWNASGYALVLCDLLTGRTHQIRVHMAAAGHPLVGDSLYGGKEILRTPSGAERVFLHSWRLAFTHPITRKPMRFTLPIPSELREYLMGEKSGR